jgi:NAD(P)-dependent dehydrogenase (short-subunit alcohol dehydrogenase family)
LAGIRREAAVTDLTGRVAIVTGAGRGLGRAYALALAAEGAAVVVNDLGGSLHGEGQDLAPAQAVVDEIRGAGGEATASGHDVSDWSEAEALVATALEVFGRLDILVNNAGILRDRLFANMSEADWDAVIRVHLKGHAAPSRHAMAHWRACAKAGEEVAASIVHTSSLAGLIGNFGQANYAAAKLGIVGLSHTLAREGAKYGVRSNAVSPSARTRIETSLEAPGPGVFDTFDPGNVAPLVCWLSRRDCPATGQVFHAYGDRIEVIAPTAIAADLRTDGRWTSDSIDRALAGHLKPVPVLSDFVPELS